LAEIARRLTVVASSDRRAAATSIAAAFGLQASLVVSGVLAARLLGPEGRGSFALLVLFPTVLFQLGSLGLPVALTYFIASERRAAAALLAVVAVPAVAQAIVLVLIHFALIAVVFGAGDEDVRRSGLITLAIVPSALASQYGLAVLQGYQRFVAFNALRILPAILYSAAVAALFVMGVGDLVAVTAGFVIANIASAIITGILAARLISAQRVQARQSLRELLRFGLKALVGAFSPIQTFRLDQAVVGLLLSPVALGHYVVGLSFTNLPHLLGQSIGAIAYPRIAASAPAARPRLLLTFALMCVAASFAVSAPLILLADRIIPFFFGSEFVEAVPVARVLLVGTFFLSAARVMSDALRGAGFPGAGSIAEVVSWLWLVPALFLLAPLWGPVGVAVALAAAHAVTVLVLVALVYVWRTRQGPRLRTRESALVVPAEPDASPERLS
jgi:O-antigen/teichoic acid export membrane protein